VVGSCSLRDGVGTTAAHRSAGIDGALLLCGSYQATPEMFETFVDLAGGPKAKIVFLTFDKARFGGTQTQGLKDAAKKKRCSRADRGRLRRREEGISRSDGLWINVDSVSPMKKIMEEGCSARSAGKS